MNESEKLYFLEQAQRGIESLHDRCNEIEKALRDGVDRQHQNAIDIAIIKTKIGIASALFGGGASIIVELIWEMIKTHLK